MKEEKESLMSIAYTIAVVVLVLVGVYAIHYIPKYLKGLI